MRRKRSLQGLCAIDIDGTLTAVRDELPFPVVDYLHTVVQEGWQLLFVTGRTLSWGVHLLHSLPFPYILSVFNGAYTVQMPEQTFIEKCYFSTKKLIAISELIKNRDVGMVVYGPADSDLPYYFFSRNASTVVLQYLEGRRIALQETWEHKNEVEEIPLKECVAVRLFCLPEVAKQLSLDIEEKLQFHAPMMKDSFDSRFSVVQVTHPVVSKGYALDVVHRHLGNKVKVIACGDDHNDISMFKKADVRVVMATAPAEVLAHADIIAPPAHEHGLIIGLERAIKLSRIGDQLTT